MKKLFALLPLLLAGCENPFEKTQDAQEVLPEGGIQGPGVFSINGDASGDHEFLVSEEGEEFTIETLEGITTFYFPNASSTQRGVLSAEDYEKFDTKIGPEGTTSALSRGGFAQSYSTAAQNLPAGAGLSLEVELDTDSRLDAGYYSRPDGKTLRILTEGSYKVSYSVAVKSGNGTRQNFRTWLVQQGSEAVPSKTYCYTRNHTSTNTCSMTGSFLLTAAAGDELQLRVQGRDTATWGFGTKAATLANEVWIWIEKI